MKCGTLVLVRHSPTSVWHELMILLTCDVLASKYIAVDADLNLVAVDFNDQYEMMVGDDDDPRPLLSLTASGARFDVGSCFESGCYGRIPPRGVISQ